MSTALPNGALRGQIVVACTNAANPQRVSKAEIVAALGEVPASISTIERVLQDLLNEGLLVRPKGYLRDYTLGLDDELLGQRLLEELSDWPPGMSLGTLAMVIAVPEPRVLSRMVALRDAGLVESFIGDHGQGMLWRLQASAGELVTNALAKAEPHPVRELLDTPVAPAVAVDLAEDTSDGFSCALWSNGKLQMVVSGNRFTLEREQTQRLMHYLDRMREPAAEPELAFPPIGGTA